MASKRPLRATLGIATALAVGCGAAVVGAVAPASALFGDVEITPIESNIAGKFWTTANASSGESTAALAIDQDVDTAWLASEPEPGQWVSLDLGGAYDNVRKVRVVFPDAGAVYQYVVETSADGESWQVIADHADNAQASRGSVDLFTQPGTRHVRVTITGTSPGAAVGVSEISVYNYLRDDIVLGADASWVDDDVTAGRNYWVHPREEDRGAGPHLLDVLKDRGLDYTRLRIFNEPRSEGSGQLTSPAFQSPERSLEVAKWIKDRGLSLGIDFHYADSWADPGKQPKPRAWAELEFDDLVDALYEYTYSYITELVDQGTTPDKVAIGNEVNNGFLWGSEAAGMTEGPVVGTANPAYFRNQAAIYQSQPGGGLLWPYMNSDDPVEQQLYAEAFDRFATLQAAGIRAVRDASPGTKVEIHSLVGSGVGAPVGPGVGNQEISGIEKAMEMWNQTLSRLEHMGQFPDVIGLSYYPEYHGTIDQLEYNMHTIATAYPELEIVNAETSYPASGGGGTPMPNATFPRTIQGQADAIQRVFQANNDIVDNQGGGVLIWEPARWQSMFRSVPGMPNTWEPHASIDIYNLSHAEHIWEDTVFRTVRVGGDIVLPDAVRVLTTADGSVVSAPVDWESLAGGATSEAGVISVAGSTEYGDVTAEFDVVDEFVGLECDEVISGRHAGSLTVDSGVTCLDGSTVSGPVSVEAGASLVSDGSQISGPVIARGAETVLLCDTRVSGPVTLTGSASVTLGNPALGCAPNTFSGPVTVTGTANWNVIAGNSISGPLSCTGNAAAPVDNGLPNRVAGPKSGQCSGL
ncbi:hypothetical protein G1H11_24155 [Phytoactinopolyspora alkaliphila]|uniref:Arabinogalactan endo-beta-1,4-galactanase n=1 Tax=Phytoactinopolyspora alkaliphila TaxID=1783498 RepID=A0A6N9YUB1_9ACTN|nr:glycosyl hydrolase 53 family protein [Phytoactinopolyspora alkaliphila]NED98398.1 hypothetical protein [Phytoactinopolyspora alkaliphila]